VSILVCPLSRVAEVVAARRPQRVVSLLDPDIAFPELGPAYAERHLRLSFHDVHAGAEGATPPSVAHITELLAFLSARNPTDTILIHCRAGIGRSTATAYVAACLDNPDVSEQDIAVALRRMSPTARPNETLVRLADAAMHRGGRMTAAIRDTGRGLAWITVQEGEPFEMPSVYVAPTSPQ
jgi:predicted protein tyrosine phosphatase